MIERVAGVQPFYQPAPARNPGGDCFACALTAAVRHLVPERPVEFDTVWECFLIEPYGGGPKVLSNSWPTMRTAIYALGQHGYELETTKDLVSEVRPDSWSHAWGLEIPEMAWAYRLEAWLAAGWVALAEVNFQGSGPWTGEYQNTIDHFVVLDGVRHYWKKHDSGVSLEHDVHVVCSARGAYWIDAGDLLRKHGTAGLTLVRRDRRE